MHQENHVVVQLVDVLEVFPDNLWKWSILDFYGIGAAPSGITMSDFEDEAHARPDGYALLWPSLLIFSAGLEQTYDCSIIASDPKTDFIRDGFEKGKYDKFHAVIQAIDSDVWNIGANENILKKLEKRFL